MCVCVQVLTLKEITNSSLFPKKKEERNIECLVLSLSVNICTHTHTHTHTHTYRYTLFLCGCLFLYLSFFCLSIRLMHTHTHIQWYIRYTKEVTNTLTLSQFVCLFLSLSLSLSIYIYIYTYIYICIYQKRLDVLLSSLLLLLLLLRKFFILLISRQSPFDCKVNIQRNFSFWMRTVVSSCERKRVDSSSCSSVYLIQEVVKSRCYCSEINIRWLNNLLICQWGEFAKKLSVEMILIIGSIWISFLFPSNRIGQKGRSSYRPG